MTIVAIYPHPENGRNGSVVNLPPYLNKCGFDKRVIAGRYAPELRTSLPTILNPGDILISSISVDELGQKSNLLRPMEKSISPVASISILIYLDKPPPPDAFRPSYCVSPDRDSKDALSIYYARNIRGDKLPALPKVPDTPDIKDWIEIFQRLWLDVCSFSFNAPVDYKPQFGREIGRAVGITSLLLMLDFPKTQKEKLLIHIIQYGIDLWGIVKAGHPGWPANGGHGSGRKWPIIFAGIRLNEAEMQEPCKSLPALKFGEDMQTMSGTGWTGASAFYAGHNGKSGIGDEGPYEHLPPVKWPRNKGESYRRCCTSVAWAGQALAVHLLQAENIWHHDAFFDYVDRWMTEDNAKAVKKIKDDRSWDYSKAGSDMGFICRSNVGKLSKYFSKNIQNGF